MHATCPRRREASRRVGRGRFRQPRNGRAKVSRIPEKAAVRPDPVLSQYQSCIRALRARTKTQC